MLAPNPYASDQCFDRHALQSSEGRRKARLLAALVPDGCRTILDAGGGTGWATIELRHTHRVVTLDSSAESLRHAEGEVIEASVDALPCGDRSFDMVMSSQVLEHLPDPVLEKAVSEMDRVASNYLLVSVPYREALDARLVRCGQCRHVFHPDHHRRSFSEDDLARLFRGWVMAEWHVFGALRRGSGVLRAHGKKRPGDIWAAFDGTVCPQCGNQVDEQAEPVAPDAPSMARRVAAALEWHIGRRLGRSLGRTYRTHLPQSVAPYWIAALFVRERSPAPIDAEIVRRPVAAQLPDHV